MPGLGQLLALIDRMPAYRRLLEKAKYPEVNRVIVLDAAKPYLIAALHRTWRVPVLVVTAQPENSKKLHEQLTTWSNSPVRRFPEPDTLPYERVVSDVSTELERVQVLSILANGEAGSDAPLVVTSAAALMTKVPLRNEFVTTCHTITLGMVTEPLHLLSRWETMGYKVESLVEIPGTISRRGGIVDVYPPTSELPVRLEFLGNTIDSLRLFDPASQRSIKTISSIFVGPATELLAPLSKDRAELERAFSVLDLSDCTDEVRQQLEQDIAMMLERQRPRNVHFYAPLFNNDSLLSYLPQSAILILDEPVGIEQTINGLDAEAGRLRSEKIERGELPQNFPKPYLTWNELGAGINSRRRFVLNSWGEEESSRLDFVSAPSFGGQLAAFVKKAKELLEKKKRVIIVSNQASRLSELLDQEDIIASPVTEVKVPPTGSLTLVHGSLAEGWAMPDTYLFTDAEIFGFVKQRRLIKKQAVPRHKLMLDITPGDYVVHVEHGIARFAGVTRLGKNGGQREYLVLQYAAGDKLYVPADQIDRVSRYIGASDQPPSLSRLGTQEWTQAKRRAKEAAELIAKELLGLYAAREVVPGFAFSQDTVWQQEMEAAFPYVETPDQLQAQLEVKQDMEKPKPMDRLVCGDVGYGKTEVAIRAAFKAVMDNKQVAVLVPTTVLAEQHILTFKQRLQAFPVRIEVLSRFKLPKEQRVILEGLAGGSVDICIGTHRLLQKDVVFKNLGLLIIDEEQRFGVIHKEHLKKMRREVDVLTLSATPIPRTLHMSLVGVRDMSVMETPPEERLPIKTYVAEYSDYLVREAILRELERNGQVFFVHNRVQSIAAVASELRLLVPEARIAIGHGRMDEAELEAVMADFAQGKFDVLVCTTIIESGLDMPNVNTLIVNQTDRFGLTQLYQLRGRVGRGANLAYAYFLYDRGKRLTPTAQKRLRTIYEATELGAGFNIAMKDLEIRGAGTLLGARQSGHISAVGFSLYTRLLADAIEEQKAGLAGAREAPKHRLPPPTIDLPLPAYIPEDYVADLNTRISLYQQLVKLEDAVQVDEVSREFRDRFGALPAEVRNLLYAVRIKALAARAGIESIYSEDGQVIIRLFEGMPACQSLVGTAGRRFDPQRLAPFKDRIKIGTTQLTLNPKRLGNWQKVLEGVVRGMG